MNMKRWLSVLCCALLCVMFCTGGMIAFAASPVTFSLTTDKATANVGDTVTVSVNITENSYLANGTFYLHFNNTAVSYVADSENVGSAAGNSAMFAANGFHDEGFVKIAFVTGSSVKKSGPLMTFEFRVLKKAAAAFSFTSDECVGCGADEIDFDIEYTSKGCVLNDDGSVTTPIITPDVPVVVTTTTKKPMTTTASKQNTATTTTPVATTTAPQNVQTDAVTTTTAADAKTTAASSEQAATTAQVQDETADVSTTTRFLTPVEDPADEEQNGLATLIVIIVIAVLVAGGLTVAALLARKKRIPTEATAAAEATADTDTAATQDPPSDETE